MELKRVYLHHHVIRAQPETTGYIELSICEMSGNTPLRYDDSLIGLGLITFNGNRAKQQAGDAFMLCHQLRPTGYEYCRTYNHPYSFLVQVSLLLANHYCPNVWKISSNIESADWQRVVDWISEYLGVLVELSSRMTKE